MFIPPPLLQAILRHAPNEDLFARMERDPSRRLAQGPPLKRFSAPYPARNVFSLARPSMPALHPALEEDEVSALGGWLHAHQDIDVGWVR